MSQLVSIVVPIYNVEPFLDRCITSIVNQTYADIEIILVDDGSPDNCPAMCDAWADKDSRIKVIHKKNEGLGEARNTGVSIATGSYVFFIDSDDYLEHNAVERCISVAVDAGADSVIFGRNKAYPDGTIKEDSKNIRNGVYAGESIRARLIPSFFDYSLGFGVSSCSKMFSLNLIKRYDLSFESERSVISEDAMFCMSYFSKTAKVAVIPDKLYYYFKNNKSITNTYKVDRQFKNNEFLNKCIEKAGELRLPESISEHIKARYHGMTLGTLMQIVRSDLRKREKKLKLRTIYRDAVLRETLTKSVIRLDAVFPRFFWICLKIRFFFLCDLLLLCNKHR